MPSVAECLNVAPLGGAEAIAVLLDRRKDDPVAKAAAEALRHLAAMIRRAEAEAQADD